MPTFPVFFQKNGTPTDETIQTVNRLMLFPTNPERGLKYLTSRAEWFEKPVPQHLTWAAALEHVVDMQSRFVSPAKVMKELRLRASNGTIAGFNLWLELTQLEMKENEISESSN